MKNKYLHVKEQLTNAISGNVYMPGDFIPSENVLARQYKMSRPSIRKALVSLEEEGIVSSQPGKGRIVVKPKSKKFKIEELCIGVSSPEKFLGDFYIPTVSRIVKVCAKLGIRVELVTDEHLADLRDVNKTHLNGIIWVAPSEEQINQLTLVASKYLPIIFVNRESQKDNVSYIVTDHQKGAYMGVEYLIRYGHHRIAFIGGPLAEYPCRERLRGYMNALTDNNIGFDPDLILDTYFSRNIAKDIDDFLSKKHFSAVFINGELFVPSTLDSLKSLGKKIPEQVSVVSFDDVNNEFEHNNPNLTSIKQPIQKLGEEAVEIILKSIKQGGVHNLKRKIMPEMIIRRSVIKQNAIIDR